MLKTNGGNAYGKKNNLHLKLQLLITIPCLVKSINIFRLQYFYIHTRIGDEVILRYAKPCHRCMVTQVDPKTGKLYEKGEPMRTLKKYRMTEPELNGPIFAVQFGIEVCGTAKIGDIVYEEI